MPASKSLANRPSPLHPDKKLGELTRAEMRQILERLPDEPEFHAGIVLLKRILDKDPDDAKAVAGFIAFTDKADNILDNTGKILKHDFIAQPNEPADSPYVLGHEEEMKKTSPLAPRRQFLRAGLRTLAWVGTGGVIAAYGAARTGSQMARYMSSPSTDDAAVKAKAGRDMFSLAHEFIDDHVMGPTDVVLGGAILNEGLENWDELKFEQISNGITEFLQFVGAYEDKKPPAKTSSRRPGR